LYLFLSWKKMHFSLVPPHIVLRNINKPVQITCKV
jgi:hypothetical protein